MLVLKGCTFLGFTTNYTQCPSESRKLGGREGEARWPRDIACHSGAQRRNLGAAGSRLGGRRPPRPPIAKTLFYYTVATSFLFLFRDIRVIDDYLL